MNDYKYLEISNSGLLEVGALTLMGASSKRGDGAKIGMFGSGNKYALAYLLRNGYTVDIYSGETKLPLTTKQVKFRNDEAVEVICVDGKETSITTSLGKDWELWQAIRELYSNAIDEGLMSFEKVIDQKPQPDTTSIYISMDGNLLNMMFNVKDYFAIGKELLAENQYGKVYRKHGKAACIYRKGIKCHITDSSSIFDYDIENIDVNEERLMKYSWQLPEGMYNILAEANDPELLRELLRGLNEDGSVIENNIDGDWIIPTAKFSDEVVREATKGKQIAPRMLGGYVADKDKPKTFFLPTKLYHNLVTATGGKDLEHTAYTVAESGALYKEVEASAVQLAILQGVEDFFKECKFDMPYKVQVVDFDNDAQMGGVAGEVILLGTTAVEKGRQYTANTIIEEYIHIKHGASDESRKFQEASIDEFLTYMQVINAYTL